VFDSVIVRL